MVVRDSGSISTVILSPETFAPFFSSFMLRSRYTLKQEIGRGSFGAVHLAVDQLGNKYVKSTVLVGLMFS